MSALAAPSQSEVERKFQEHMIAHGYMCGSVTANLSDFERFDAPGDKPNKRNGYYKLLSGNFPVGWYGDWKTGEQIEWQWDFQRELSPKERQKIKNEHRRLKHEAEVAREARQREVAEDANKIWKEANTNAAGHAYLVTKGIETPRGLRIHVAKDGTQLLCVPMWSFDMNGQVVLTSLQMISPDGQKRFLKAGRTRGCFFSLKGDSNLIVQCEGVATGYAIWEATGASVVCAFNSGNMVEVAKDMRRWRPLAAMMIAGDNDEIAPDDWEEKGRGKPWVNEGRLKAEAAARAIGCRWIIPAFADGPARSRTDYDDLKRLEGVDMLRSQILGAIKTVDPTPEDPGGTIVEVDFVQDESWRTKLPITSQGNSDATNVEGVALYLQNHKLLRGRLSFNLFAQAVELDGNELGDHDVAEFRRIMHHDRFKAKKTDVVDEMFAEARRNSFDPLADYLNNLTWDGQPRISMFAHYYLGAPDKLFSHVAGRKFLIGAVARALRPGVKFDTALILEGPQGIFKSTAIRYLFGDRFFVDHLPDFHSKDSFQQLQGNWCVEIAELSAMGKADVSDVKQFLSRLEDVYRPPYGKLPIRVKRRTVFVGSVNPEENGYLRDNTGGRRFWPLETGVVSPIQLDAILRDRDQLWAEAVVAFSADEPFHLTKDEDKQAALLEQEARREVDPWEWALRKFISDEQRSALTIEEALLGAVGMGKNNMDSRAQRRMGAALKNIGWAGKTERLPMLGPVRLYRPDPNFVGAAVEERAGSGGLDF